MYPPHQLLLYAAARLNAHGHTSLAQDLRQLARHYTPSSETELVGQCVDSDPDGMDIGRTGRSTTDLTITHP